jgi:hypothetical protein
MFVLLSLVLVVVLGAPKEHEVLSLPGWNEKLPTRQFSGLVDIGAPPSGQGRMLMHYWFVESEVSLSVLSCFFPFFFFFCCFSSVSQGNPKTDPVLMWYNGGQCVVALL